MQLRSDYSLTRHIVDEMETAKSSIASPPAIRKSEPPAEKVSVPERIQVPSPPNTQDSRAASTRSKATFDLRADWKLSHSLSTDFEGALSADSEELARRGTGADEDKPAPEEADLIGVPFQAGAAHRPPPANKLMPTLQSLIPAPWLGVSHEVGSTFPGQASPSPPPRRPRAVNMSHVTNKENDADAGKGNHFISMGKFKIGLKGTSVTAF